MILHGFEFLSLRQQRYDFFCKLQRYKDTDKGISVASQLFKRPSDCLSAFGCLKVNDYDYDDDNDILIPLIRGGSKAGFYFN